MHREIIIGISLFLILQPTWVQSQERQPFFDQLKSSPEGREFLGVILSEPSIQEVQKSAIEQAKINLEVTSRWRKRVLQKAWLPDFAVGTRQNLGSNESFRISTDTEVNDTGDVYVGPDAQSLVIANQNDFTLQFRAEWHLNELLFHEAELKIPKVEEDIVTLRNEILETVTKLYFERRRLQVSIYLLPAKEPAERLMQEIKLQEVTSALDALTGGLFTLSHQKQSLGG